MANGSDTSSSASSSGGVVQASAVTAGAGGAVGAIGSILLAPVLAKNPLWQPVAAVALPSIFAWLANILHQKLGWPT